MFGQKRIPSREGGVEIVVEELCTRMVAQGHNVTCYNRGGHHVSGSEFDSKRLKEYKGIKLKTVPTIEKKGLKKLYDELNGKNILILVPGSSVTSDYFNVQKYIEKKKPVIISVNFIHDKIDSA